MLKMLLGEISDGNEEHVTGNLKKAGFVIKWWRTWLNYVPVFYGR